MRLIYADKLAREFERHPDRWYFGRDVLREIGEAEAVEAEPVRRGRWIIQDVPSWAVTPYKCSVCGEEIFEEDYKYCPNCGARMDGDGNA